MSSKIYDEIDGNIGYWIEDEIYYISKDKNPSTYKRYYAKSNDIIKEITSSNKNIIGVSSEESNSCDTISNYFLVKKYEKDVKSFNTHMNGRNYYIKCNENTKKTKDTNNNRYYYPPNRVRKNSFKIHNPKNIDHYSLCKELYPHINNITVPLSSLLCSQLKNSVKINEDWVRLFNNIIKNTITENQTLCTSVGRKISESLIKIASLRIFAEPEQSIMELPINSMDSYNPQSKIGKFGMGFFSFLYWLIDHPLRKLYIYSWFRSQKSTHISENINSEYFVCSYRAILQYTKDHGITINIKIFENSRVTKTGTLIYLDTQKDNITQEQKNNFDKQIKKLMFTSSSKLFFMSETHYKNFSDIPMTKLWSMHPQKYYDNKELLLNPCLPFNFTSQENPNEIYCYISKDKIFVEDYASGISLNTLLSSLLIPSVSTKTIKDSLNNNISNTDFYEPNNILIDNLPFDSLNTHKKYILINNCFIINVGGVSVINIKNSSSSYNYSIIIDMPISTKVPVSRDDILLNEVTYKLFVSNIVDILNQGKQKRNILPIQSFLNKYVSYTSSDLNKKAVSEALSYFHENNKGYLASESLYGNIFNIDNLCILSDTSDTISLEERLIKSLNCYDDIFYGKKVVFIKNLRTSVEIYSFSTLVFVNENFKDSTNNKWPEHVAQSKPEFSLAPIKSIYGEEEIKKYESQLPEMIKNNTNTKIRNLYLTLIAVFNGLSVKFKFSASTPLNFRDFLTKISLLYDYTNQEIILNSFLSKFLSFKGNQTYGGMQYDLFFFNHSVLDFNINMVKNANPIEISSKECSKGPFEIYGNKFIKLQVESITECINSVKESTIVSICSEPYVSPFFMFSVYVYENNKIRENPYKITHLNLHDKSILLSKDVYEFVIEKSKSIIDFIIGIISFGAAIMDIILAIIKYYDLVQNIPRKVEILDGFPPLKEVSIVAHKNKGYNMEKTIIEQFLGNFFAIMKYSMNIIMNKIINFGYTKDDIYSFIHNPVSNLSVDSSKIINLYKNEVIEYYNIIRSKNSIKLSNIYHMPSKNYIEFTISELIEYLFTHEKRQYISETFMNIGILHNNMKKINEEKDTKNKLQITEIAINEGTTKGFVESILTELTQNSVDAIKSTNNKIRDININYGTAPNNKKSFVISIQDFVGMNEDAFLHISIPFISTKTPSELVTGEMGSGFFNVYRYPAKMVVIDTVYNNVRYTSYDTPIYSYPLEQTSFSGEENLQGRTYHRDRVIDVLKKVVIQPSRKKISNGTTIYIYSMDLEENEIAEYLAKCRYITSKVLSQITFFDNINLIVNNEYFSYRKEKTHVLSKDNFEVYFVDNKLPSYILTKGIPFAPLSKFYDSYYVSVKDFMNNGVIINIKHGGYTPIQTRTKINMATEQQNIFDAILLYMITIKCIYSIVKFDDTENSKLYYGLLSYGPSDQLRITFGQIFKHSLEFWERKCIGFQQFLLFLDLNYLDNIPITGVSSGVDDKINNKNIPTKVENCGLGDFTNKLIDLMNGRPLSIMEKEFEDWIDNNKKYFSEYPLIQSLVIQILKKWGLTKNLDSIKVDVKGNIINDVNKKTPKPDKEDSSLKKYFQMWIKVFIEKAVFAKITGWTGNNINKIEIVESEEHKNALGYYNPSGRSLTINTINITKEQKTEFIKNIKNIKSSSEFQSISSYMYKKYMGYIFPSSTCVHELEHARRHSPHDIHSDFSHGPTNIELWENDIAHERTFDQTANDVFSKVISMGFYDELFIRYKTEGLI